MVDEAFFERDGDRFVPSDQARGPWDPNTLHGRVIAGLLGYATEQHHGDDEFQPSRLTVDMFRVPPWAPVEVSTTMAREGRRIRVVEGTMTSDGVEIARSRAVLLKRAEDPDGDVWRPPAWDVPAPDAVEPPPARGNSGRQPIWETRPIDGGFGSVGQKRAWLRETRPLIEGEATSPFVRIAVAADFANPFANSGTGGLNFVNADVTLYLHRLPVGEWLGFEVSSHQSAQGVAVGECSLYDVEGAIGRSVVCAVANQRR